MQPTQTGIATALAVVVVALFLILPNSGLFTQHNVPSTEQASVGAVDITQSPADQSSPSMTTNTPAEPAKPLTELMMNDEVVGTGAVATAGDTVTVNYVGMLTNGTVFDASAKHGTTGFTFKLGAGQVIKGWDQGVAGMKVGGKRMLAIPASLAYGSQAVGGVIPANSDLVFQVELLDVKK